MKRATNGVRILTANCQVRGCIWGESTRRPLVFPPHLPYIPFLLRKTGRQRRERPGGALVWRWVFTGRDLGAPEWARLREEAQAGGNSLSRLRPPAGLGWGGPGPPARGPARPAGGPVPPREPRGNGATDRDAAGLGPPGRDSLPAARRRR